MWYKIVGSPASVELTQRNIVIPHHIPKCINITGVVFKLMLERQLKENISMSSKWVRDQPPCYHQYYKCNYQFGLHQKFINACSDWVTYITELLVSWWKCSISHTCICFTWLVQIVTQIRAIINNQWETCALQHIQTFSIPKKHLWAWINEGRDDRQMQRKLIDVHAEF